MEFILMSILKLYCYIDALKMNIEEYKNRIEKVTTEKETIAAEKEGLKKSY